MTPLIESPQLDSDRLDTQSRTYFFDLRESKNSKRYLTIKESYSRGGQRHEAVLTIWPEDADAFKAKLIQMLQHLS